MRWSYAVLVFASVLALPLPGLSAAAVDPDEFLGRYHNTIDGSSLPYRLYVPGDYSPSKEYPLILYLHGSGRMGTDNTDQLSGIGNLLNHVKMPQYSSFLLAPQASGGWASLDANPTVSLGNTLSVIKGLEYEYNIDVNRIYVIGVSMGGAGAWDAMCYHDEFAAGVPISGYYSTSEAPLLVDKPLWVFHAADDYDVSVSYDRDMIAAIRALGGNPLYTEYETGGHSITSRVYDEEAMYEWMSSQSLDNGSTAPEPGSLCLLLGGAMAVAGCATWRRFLAAFRNNCQL